MQCINHQCQMVIDGSCDQCSVELNNSSEQRKLLCCCFTCARIVYDQIVVIENAFGSDAAVQRFAYLVDLQRQVNEDPFE